MNCLIPSSSFLKERQIKVLWEFVYRRVKTLIVRAGRRDTNKYPQVTYHPIPVMFSLYWNARVEKTKMSCENSGLLLLFVLTLTHSRCVPSLLHITLIECDSSRFMIAGTMKSYWTTHTDLSDKQVSNYQSNCTAFHVSTQERVFANTFANVSGCSTSVLLFQNIKSVNVPKSCTLYL